MGPATTCPARTTAARATAALVATALLAACGSTAQGTLTTSAGAGTGLSLPGAPGIATADGLAPAPGTDVATGGAGPVGSVGHPATTPGGGAGGSRSAAVATDGGSSSTGGDSGGSKDGAARIGPGVTDRQVLVGMVYSPDLNDAQEAAGSDSLSTGNPRAQQEALLEEINRRGGLAGRKVVLDAYAISATTPDVEQAFNAACEHFTQDTKVFAVLTAGPASFGTCLEKGGVLQLASDLTAASRSTTGLQAHGYRPAGIAMEDSAELLVSGLDQMRWFPKDAVVGVITFDAPVYQDTVKKVMLPALKAVGHPSREEFYASTPRSLSDYGAMSSSISSAVLRFRQAGVTHLLMFDQQGRIATFFIPAAENQGYRPKYGFTSQAGFQVGVTGGGIPPEQARGAAGIGWLPAFDVPLSVAPSAGAKRCKDFFTAQQMPPTNENSTLIQQFQCQDSWLLDTVLDQLPREVTREAFRRVADAGAPQLAAANLAMGFTPRSHDGTRAVRNVAWQESCGCFQYVGGNRQLG